MEQERVQGKEDDKVISDISRRTVIETGSASGNAVSERTRFSKKPPELTEFEGGSQKETVTLTHGAPASPPAPLEEAPPPAAAGSVKFADLSGAERSEYKQTLKDLSRQARLWARDEAGNLQRINPANAKERLDAGQAVELVTRLGSESTRSGSRDSYEFSFEHLLVPDDFTRRSSSADSARVQVFYTSSPISSWDSLDWVDEDARGVPGTPSLPPSGGTATISSSFESSWRKFDQENWGIFRVRTRTEASSGYKTIRQVADTWR